MYPHVTKLLDVFSLILMILNGVLLLTLDFTLYFERSVAVILQFCIRHSYIYRHTF